MRCLSRRQENKKYTYIHDENASFHVNFQIAQYDAYWGDQLLPKFVYDAYRAGCVDLAGGFAHRSDDCEELEEKMDCYIGV